jgi:hypothetical protein
MKQWQESMLDDLKSKLVPNEDVIGLLLYGSFSKPELLRDEWSDIDVLVVVQDDRLVRFFPTVEWLTAFGSLYTTVNPPMSLNAPPGHVSKILTGLILSLPRKRVCPE